MFGKLTQGPAPGNHDKASRGRGVIGAGLRLRGQGSGAAPGARSGEYQYHAIALVDAADREKLIDCKDCHVSAHLPPLAMLDVLPKSESLNISLRDSSLGSMGSPSPL